MGTRTGNRPDRQPEAPGRARGWIVVVLALLFVAAVGVVIVLGKNR